jgi:hypothetical protein
MAIKDIFAPQSGANYPCNLLPPCKNYKYLLVNKHKKNVQILYVLKSKIIINNY